MLIIQDILQYTLHLESGDSFVLIGGRAMGYDDSSNWAGSCQYKPSEMAQFIQQLMMNLCCNQTLINQPSAASPPLSSPHYNYTLQIDRFLQSSLPVQLCTRFPMQKLLRQTSKLLELNLFQASLLHWMLKSSQWKDEKSLSNIITELIKFDEFTFECREYAVLFACVLVNGYYVKMFVNGGEVVRAVEQRLEGMCPGFRVGWERWQKHQSLKSLSLATVNEIFKGNSRVSTDQQIDVNYNTIVDKILDLAKPYNVGVKEEAEDEDEDRQDVEEVDEQPKEVRNKKKVKAAVEQKKKKERRGGRKKQQPQQQPTEKKHPKKLTTSRKSFESPPAQPERKPLNRTVVDLKTGNSLRRSVRKQQHFISSQQQDLDIFNRRNVNTSENQGFMLQSQRSDYHQDMFKSVDSRWSNMYKFQSRRTINNDSIGPRRFGESLMMTQTKQPVQQPKPAPPDLTLRRVDSEEF